MLGLSFAIVLLALSICTVGLMLVQTYNRYRYEESLRRLSRAELARQTLHEPRSNKILGAIIWELSCQGEEQVEAWYEKITGHEFHEEEETD